MKTEQKKDQLVAIKISCYQNSLLNVREVIGECDNDHYGFEHYLDDYCYWDEQESDCIDYFTVTSESNILIDGPDIRDEALNAIFGERQWEFYYRSPGSEGYHYNYEEILSYWEKWKKELKPFENLNNLENLKPGEIFWRD